MEEILSNPNGVRLYHEQGRRFDLRIHDQSVLGTFSLTWSFTGSQGQDVDLQSSRLTLSEIRPDRRGQGVRLEYPPYGGARVGVRFRIRDDGLVVQQYLEKQREGLGDPLVLHTFTIQGEDTRASFLSGAGRDPGWRFFPLGYSSFTPVWSRDSREVQKRPPVPTAAIFNQHVDSVFWNRDEALTTPWMATIQRTGIDSTLLLGYLEARVTLGEVALVRGAPARVVLRADFGGKTVSREQEVCSDPLLIAFGRDGDGLVEAYTREVGERMEARVPHSVPSGWCSWYYYYTRVQERDVLSNLEVLAEQKERLPVTFVQLDDGYQTFVGDWLSTNRKFLGGLQNLASQIRAQGFVPGIWTAPFFVQRGSVIHRHHQDWLLHDADGKPVWMGYLPTWGVLNGHLYGLDPTHPEVLDYLAHVFSTLVEFGFEYFKIDFLFAGLKPGRRYDPKKSPVEAYRAALRHIRHVIGDRFLLGCGAPLLPSIGIVDAMRISPDVKESWRDPIVGFLARGVGHPSAELALLNCVTRAHLHGVWWLNDPDCLLVREKNSALTLEEVQTLVSILSLTGGMLFLSDDLAQLSLERRALAELALPPRGAPARTLGVRVDARPSRFVRHYQGPTGLQEAVGAVINWADTPVVRSFVPADFDLPDRTYHAFEFWSGSYQLLSASHPLEIALKPHQAAVLTLRPREDRPQLVSATHHLGQVSTIVSSERWTSGHELRIALDIGADREGTVVIAIPEGHTVQDVSTEGGARITGKTLFEGGMELSVPTRGSGVLIIRFTGNQLDATAECV